MKIYIEDLISNSNSKLLSASLLADNSDYSSAISLLVTAFEEKTKAVVLQFLDLGYKLVDNIKDLDYIFKHHDGRHYIGYLIDCVTEIVYDCKDLLNRLINDQKFVEEILTLKVNSKKEELLLLWINQKIDSFINKIEFYQNIEKTRQNGLYIDVLTKGKTRKKITKKDFDFVKNKLNNVHLLSQFLLEIKNNTDKKIIDSLTVSRNNVIEKKIPTHISSSILLIKKERNKTFNEIRKSLISFKNDI